MGGADDNFFLTKLSPAIDRGAILVATDFYGNARTDDTGTANAAGAIADLGAIEFRGYFPRCNCANGDRDIMAIGG